MAQSDNDPRTSRLWSPEHHGDRRPFLLARSRIMSAWRAWFEAQGFMEVDTAILQTSPGNEAHIGAFSTQLAGPSGVKKTMYLHTSPEYACKKLLAAGERKIFTFAHVFRNGERGPLHHPEFTMLEWYRAGESYDTLIADCSALVNLAAKGAGAARLQWRGAECDPELPVQRLSVAEAFKQHAGIDIAATLRDAGPDRELFAEQAQNAGLRITPDDTWSDIFSKIISDRIEPCLGREALTVLDRYPASEAALARLCPDDPRFSQRFELYACGVELANAFGELTDADEQRRRFETEMRERDRIYGDPYPLDPDFLDALAIMPEASGIALGVDRLIALACGAPAIDHVMWTPVAG